MRRTLRRLARASAVRRVAQKRATRADTPAAPVRRLTRLRCSASASARLWTPTSARPAAARVAQSTDAHSPLLSLSGPASTPVVARRGEEGPNPMVMERFQSVISSLFNQASPARASIPPPVQRQRSTLIPTHADAPVFRPCSASSAWAAPLTTTWRT